ncbi:30S ribosomal protein S5, partial [Candidatus Woesearchaeota archaeon]|nr:30S ribosomal protein S5 [Candidatus Woesearchaeota archaeon]
KTGLGKKVKAGEITSIEEILDKGYKILEAEIVDALVPGLATELLFIGQSKGKFGGGQRRVFKQTQKKTAEGNKPHFAAMCIVGNLDGYLGIGYGKSKETVPSREKAMRNAKIHIMKMRRGCGSWQCGCGQPHSIPCKIQGRCGSCRITLMPAPKGAGLKIERECAKVLKLVGIKDIWSITNGQTRTKTNMIAACIEALKKLVAMKIPAKQISALGIAEGKIGEGNHG